VNSIHLGWSPFFENQLAAGDRSCYSVGRILAERKACYVLLEKELRPVALARRTVNLGRKWGNL